MTYDGPPWATVVVLFHPDDATLESVGALRRWGYSPIVVVNAIDEARWDALEAIGPTALIRNRENVGLARALNQGIERALGSGAEHVLLLDQDSRPDERMGAALVSAAVAASSRGVRVGCVGPVLVDRKAPDAVVSAASAAAGELAPSLTIATSGALVSREALRSVGGMWDALFIDGIDHEWCFRARAAGFGVFVAPQVRMTHDMGDHGVSLFGRYKPIHRSPFRHYHIVRNGLWLARCAHIPARWRAVETLKLLYRAPAYVAFSAERPSTIRAIARGVKDGLRPATRPARTGTGSK